MPTPRTAQDVASGQFTARATLVHSARTNTEAYVLRKQHRGMHNDWVFSDIDTARRWRNRAKDEEARAAADAEFMARIELWGPVVDAAVDAVWEDDWLEALIDAQIEQAAMAILAAKVQDFNKKKKEERAAQKAKEEEEKNKTKARDDLKKKREAEKKAKEKKEKAEMARIKKELIGR